MSGVDRDLVSLAHRLIVGYEASPETIEALTARAGSLDKLRSLLLLNFDTGRQMEMLRVMDFLHRGREHQEARHDDEMSAFLALDPEREARIGAAIAARDDEYSKFHGRRFFDQIRAVSAIRTKLLTHVDTVNVLDIGVMAVARLYATGAEGLLLHTTDHPRRAAENESFGTANFFPADLETEELSVRYPELIGRFHIIVFCEVLEHLKLAPEEILRDFARLLAPGGMIYLTTPNGMSAGNFLAYFEGKSPVVRYSRMNPNAHLHNYIHVREYTAREMEAGIQGAGLRIRHRAIREYFQPDSLWATAFVGARSLLTYVVELP